MKKLSKKCAETMGAQEERDSRSTDLSAIDPALLIRIYIRRVCVGASDLSSA